jgi:hypothetical protein
MTSLYNCDTACLLLVVTCVAFLASEVATNSVPLHYFEVRNGNCCQIGRNFAIGEEIGPAL